MEGAIDRVTGCWWEKGNESGDMDRFVCCWWDYLGNGWMGIWKFLRVAGSIDEWMGNMDRVMSCCLVRERN